MRLSRVSAEPEPAASHDSAWHQPTTVLCDRRNSIEIERAVDGVVRQQTASLYNVLYQNDAGPESV
jgi:hypothetical protein